MTTKKKTIDKGFNLCLLRKIGLSIICYKIFYQLNYNKIILLNYLFIISIFYIKSILWYCLIGCINTFYSL